jgi:hypothetical protein
MNARTFVGLVAATVLGAACTRSPTKPTSFPSTSDEVRGADAAVSTMVSLAISQAAIAAPPGGFSGNALEIPCSLGGSMKFTMTRIPDPPSFSSSSRMEYVNCNSGGLVLNGDPYLEMTSSYTSELPTDGVPGRATITTRMTGGVRFEMNGLRGRSQYDCTHVSTITYSAGGGAPQFERHSTGTITWESPLGNPVARPCGPA